MGCLTFSELSGMSPEEMMDRKDDLPSELDISTLDLNDEACLDGFKYWIDYCAETEKKEMAPVEELKKSMGISSTRYFAAGLGGIFPTISVHELGHGLAALVTGGKVHGFEASNEGICTIVSTPNDVSYVTTLLAPNFVLPIAGFYLIRKGFEEKKGEYIGLGICSAVGGVNHVPWYRGDFFSAVNYLFELPEAKAAAAATALIALNYAVAYCASGYLHNLEKRIKGMGK